MSLIDDCGSLGILRPIVAPWYESLKDPAATQKALLPKLLKGYSTTHYGTSCHADQINETDDFRKHFRIMNYRTLQPHLERVERGDFEAFLSEPLACWVMTRGSTGPAKVFPVTQTHLEQIFTCGARALVNHAMRRKDLELITGRIFNLNFPSCVHTITVQGRTMSYGYSSGTYARLNPALESVSLLPRQEDIDALGPGITKSDWEKRFELAYQQGLSANVTAAMGVTPVILSFARYVERKHGKKPRDLWKLRALFCTSVRKIHFKYGPILKKYFGQIPIVEIYSATEGVFGQQIDDLPYVTPNYDAYFLEVETRRGIKMLHELQRGEWGRLVVSSSLLPRYRIGDLIECAGKDYFRIFGRDKLSTILEHRLYNIIFARFT